MKNIVVFSMLLRAFRYCSTFQAYPDEREKLRMALLVDKYPNRFIHEQFNDVLLKLNVDQLLSFNSYGNYRKEVIEAHVIVKVAVDYGKTMFVHFTYYSSIKTFPSKFNAL